MTGFKIDGRSIGHSEPPYIIAELSGNHNGRIDRAFALMEAAKKSGADAVKLQTYTADTITIDHDGPGFVVELPMWKGRRLHELYQEAHTPWEWHEALFAKGSELGITVFSSPFDLTAVEFLEQLNAPAYKIASFELVDTGLIERCAATGKPLIISTGMASEAEISDAVTAARRGGAAGLALLQCVSCYPAPVEEANLSNIPELERRFGVVAGLSDHTVGNVVAISAVAVGARIIEKHVTLRRADGGVDAAFSLEPEELSQLVKDCRIATQAIGNPRFGVKESEKDSVRYRRSLYAVEHISKGDLFTTNNVRSIRPGYGLPPKCLPVLLGTKASQDIARGTPLDWTLVER